MCFWIFKVELNDINKLNVELIVVFGKVFYVDYGFNVVFEPGVFLYSRSFQSKPKTRSAFLMVKAESFKHQEWILSHSLRILRGYVGSQTTGLNWQSGEYDWIWVEFWRFPVNQSVVFHTQKPNSSRILNAFNDYSCPGIVF